ncbi:winged helix-turn-helix domain-containing protein [Halococcus sediminicola]|uniref:winged helix-turn-helix domain-containing protein n=1 Tax=Halococcus sediminicola TaxID=1264579 RepID=UPI0006792D4C|nr:helix-turn-helix domain-containing protein [Halococcus sediminicola]
MTDFDPTPSDGETNAVRQRWSENTDTFGRVYNTLLGITEPTTYSTIAEIADCSPNAAKKHLERLAEMGVGRVDRQSRPARYERNDGYLEWQDASRLADELTVEEIIDRVHQLEDRREEFEQRFETSDPSSISVFDHDNHDAIHERMNAISDWQSLERDIRLYELARQLSQNDGHLLPA